MKDLFGNKRPVQIEGGEWWFNGRIIQRQTHPLLSKYVSFADSNLSYLVIRHNTFKEAVKYAILNPCTTPNNLPNDYLS